MEEGLFFDERQQVLLLTFGPALMSEVALRAQRAVADFVNRYGRHDTILDFSAVRTVRLSGDFIQQLARTGPFMAGKTRVFVAPSNLLFGLGRMFEQTQDAFSGDGPTVVRALAEAYALLGLTEPHFELAAAFGHERAGA